MSEKETLTSESRGQPFYTRVAIGGLVTIVLTSNIPASRATLAR